MMTIKEAEKILQEEDPLFLEEWKEHGMAHSDQSVILYAECVSRKHINSCTEEIEE